MSDDPRFQPHEVRWNPETTRRLWRYYSTSAEHEQKYFGRQAGGEVAALLDRKLFGKVSRILDFSCGTGDLIQACLPRLRPNQTFHGTDFSAESVETAASRNQGRAGFAGVSVLERYPSPFADASFDLVIATEVVEHLNDGELAAAFHEIGRLLAPGGYVFLTTPFQENLGAEKTQCPECGCTFHRWQHLQSWTLESLRATVEGYGMRTIECRDIQWGPWLLKCYFRLTGRSGNGIYYIGQKPL